MKLAEFEQVNSIWDDTTQSKQMYLQKHYRWNLHIPGDTKKNETQINVDNFVVFCLNITIFWDNIVCPTGLFVFNFHKSILNSFWVRTIFRRPPKMGKIQKALKNAWWKMSHKSKVLWFFKLV